jgi:hypothetical protein
MVRISVGEHVMFPDFKTLNIIEEPVRVNFYVI